MHRRFTNVGFEPEQADALTEVIVSAVTAEVATKSDLEHLAVTTESEITILRKDVDALRSEFKEFRIEMRGAIDELKELINQNRELINQNRELINQNKDLINQRGTEIAHVETRLTHRFYRAMAIQTGLLGLLVTILQTFG